MGASFADEEFLVVGGVVIGVASAGSSIAAQNSVPCQVVFSLRTLLFIYRRVHLLCSFV